MDVIYLSDFKQSFNNYFSVLPIIQENLNLLIYTNDIFLIECYLNTALSNVYDNVLTCEKFTFNNVPFLYNINFVIFDLTSIHSQFDELTQYFDHISNNQVIFKKKLILIIKNIHILTRNQQYIFSRLYDSLQKVYTIIITTNNISKIIVQLQSRLSVLKIPVNNLNENIIKYANDNHIENASKILEQCNIVNTDLYTKLIALHTGSYKNHIYDEIYKLIEICKKSKIVPTYLSKVRAAYYKIIIYNISHSQLCNIILNCIIKKYNKKSNFSKIHHIIHDLSILECNIIKSSKPLYHYELFFLKLFKIINS